MWELFWQSHINDLMLFSVDINIILADWNLMSDFMSGVGGPADFKPWVYPTGHIMQNTHTTSRPQNWACSVFLLIHSHNIVQRQARTETIFISFIYGLQFCDALCINNPFGKHNCSMFCTVLSHNVNSMGVMEWVKIKRFPGSYNLSK